MLDPEAQGDLRHGQSDSLWMVPAQAQELCQQSLHEAAREDI